MTTKLHTLSITHLPLLAADKTSRVPETVLLAEVAPLMPATTDGKATTKGHGYVAIRPEDGSPAYLIAPTGRVVGEKAGTHSPETIAQWYAMGTAVDYATARQAYSAVAATETIAEETGATSGESVTVLASVDKAVRSKIGGFSKPDAIVTKVLDAYAESGENLMLALAAFDESLVKANRKANSRAPREPQHKSVERKALEALQSLVATLQEGKHTPDPQVMADLVTLMGTLLDALKPSEQAAA